MNSRLADYLLTDSALLSLLQGMDGLTAFRLEGLPSDPVVVGITHDDNRRSFRIRIASPDHDEVPEGAPVPVMWWRVRSAYRYTDKPNFDIEAIRRNHDLGATDGVIAYEDRRRLLIVHDHQAVRIASLEAELTTLRTIFASDYLVDCDPARLAYEQGWRDAQRQAALRVPHPPLSAEQWQELEQQWATTPAATEEDGPALG